MLSTEGVKPCPDCGKPIRVAITAHGREQRLNPQPDPTGNTAAYYDGTKTLRARGLTKDRPTLEHAEWLARPHYPDCTGRPPRRSGSGTPRRRTGVRPAPWQRWPR
ncbi:hypothetical protein ACWGDX_02940 [Streptomyces sp. NPDC055025]